MELMRIVAGAAAVVSVMVSAFISIAIMVDVARCTDDNVGAAEAFLIGVLGLVLSGLVGWVVLATLV